MKYAPVILFVYNRPDFAQQTLQSLTENALANETELFIFADGPKLNCTDKELKKILSVREVIREKKWCGVVNIIESEFNKGLAKSVIDGVSEIISKFGKVIVVEDDVLLSPYFLTFMNDALLTYQNNDKVFSIGSWNYFADPGKIKDETFFFRFPDSIAWATFARSWNLFEVNSEKLLNELKSNGKLNNFNAGLKFPYFSNMLQAHIEGKISSWAIRWTAIAVLKDKLTLFPTVSLSKHIGFSDDATHEKNVKDYNESILLCERKITVVPEKVEENSVALNEWKKFYLKNFIPKVTLNNFIRSVLKSVLPIRLIESYRKLRYKIK